MSFSDNLKFEAFNLKEMLKKIKKDPERIFIGAGDPASSKMWGKVLGKDYEPVVDQWGGASKDTYKKAEAAGIKTGSAKTMHGMARTIAAIFAGGAAGKALGGAGSGVAGNGFTVQPGSGLQLGAGTGSGSGLVIAPGEGLSLGASTGSGSGLSTGSGSNVIGSGIGDSIGASGSTSGVNWQQLGRAFNTMGNSQQQAQQPVEESDVEFQQADLSNGGPYATSSRELKERPTTGMSDVIARGAAGEDPIDQNGVHIAAIQALTKRVDAAAKRLKELQGAKR